MERIGIVTFWRNNYGSSLQAYATKTYLESKGFSVDILNERYKGFTRYSNYLHKKFDILIWGIKHKGFFSYYKENKRKKSKSNTNLSVESSRCIESFVKYQLNPYETTYSDLENYAYRENVKMILAGSDQIWNCSSGIINPYYFLEFAPKTKRLSFATSFGISEVPYFLKQDLTRLLINFKNISVRENEGVKIVDDLLQIKVERLSDPTLLLTKKEWEIFSEKAHKKYMNYIFLHFIDEPNEIAINTIKMLQGLGNKDIIVFGYHYEIFNQMLNIINVDGGPEDYVWYINHADCVLTDSFHTSLFSINLESNFYVFNRQYKQLLSQNSRILTLLKLFNYSDHLITNQIGIEQLMSIDLHDVSKIIEKERNKIKTYLDSEIPKKLNLGNENKLKNNDECTGCGACIAICPNKAIKMNPNEKGFAFPKISKDLCVNCGLCANICNFKYENKVSLKLKKAYVAYDSNSEDRNKAASGGVFTAIARNWIKGGGVVYGAALIFENGEAELKHICIDNEYDIYKIQGSKYVQCSCYESFNEIKILLQQNKKVLFGGTSCQIDALYRYLGKRDSINLLTIDLICHGVPSQLFFRDYLNYLGNRYNGKIIDFSFRKKTENSIEYIESLILKKKNKEYTKYIDSASSSFYKLFLLGESYRESCYNCKYASLNKPADITLGDYFELNQDYPELSKKIVNEKGCGVSCVIIHTINGQKIWNALSKEIVSYEVDINTVQKSHQQLCHPMRHSSLREMVFDKYQKEGYKSVANYFLKQNIVLSIPRFIKYQILKK